MNIEKMIVYIKELDKEITLENLQGLTPKELQGLETEIVATVTGINRKHLGRELSYTVDLIPANVEKLKFEKQVNKSGEKTLNDLWIKKKYKIPNGISLIVAPCGSGKTYFTFNTLIQGEKLENIIYLCDTRNLKNAVALDKDYSHLCRFYSKTDDNNVVKGSQLLFGEGLGENKITVMTYAQFGYYAKSNPDAFEGIKLVVCDEAHQLVDYRLKFDNEESDIYEVAIDKIKQLSVQAKVVMLSATPTGIEYKKGFKVPVTYDFTNEPNIKRLKENMVIPYYTNRDIKKIITEFKAVAEGKKMLVYTDRITTVNSIVKSCHEVGLKATGLWSLNNKENAMSTYQLECLESVIRDSLIPEDLDILVINASLQTGVNIKNDDIEWAIVNSANKTTQIQARSRVRNDLDRLYIKSNDVIPAQEINIDEKWLNTSLTSHDKQALCNELSIFNERGRLKKWKGLSADLIEQGYSIKDSSIRIDGKITRVSIIAK